MKIGIIGLNIKEGNVKYNDEKLAHLEEKLSPKKVCPFFAEFTSQNLAVCEAIVVKKEKILDLLILDMDKLENRMEKATDEKEKQIIGKCLQFLEKELPLCDAGFTEEELPALTGIAPLSMKPTLLLEEEGDADEIIKKILEKANLIFFYTQNKNELKAWLAKKDSPVALCAGKIHTDMEKGFIKAVIVKYDDFVTVYNMHEAKEKGLVKEVGRDYPVRDGDIIEIRFNVSKKT